MNVVGLQLGEKDSAGTREISGLESELVVTSTADPELFIHRYSSNHEVEERIVSTGFKSIAVSPRSSIHDDEKQNEPLLIDFQPGDPTDPRNFSTFRKYIITLCIVMLLLNSTFASSVSSGASTAIREYFNVPTIMTTLLVSLYMLGFVLGPLFWAPLSEYVGRRYILYSSFSLYICFTIGCAVAPSIGSLLTFRFLQGLSGTCPIAISGGVFADIYSDSTTRGRAVAFFCGSTIMGSLSGPFVSGYVSTSSLGWRWVFWITAIFAGVCLIILLLSLPETFRPVLIMRRARKLRKEGQNVVSAFEMQSGTMRDILFDVLMRPLNMLFKEIIIALICLYIGFAYGLFYMFFFAYPVIFQEERGMKPGPGGLTLLPIGAGAALVTVAHYRYDIYVNKQKNSGVDISIEFERLPVTIVAAWFLPIGLFWLGWTAYLEVPFYVNMLGGIFFGFGFTSIFIGFLNYVTDCYKIYAASAHGIMSVTRSLIAAIFPLFASKMYQNLGVHWATTLWAIIALVMAPIPLFFYKYGERLRKRSAFCMKLSMDTTL
ncbi:major facilitator superfamily domain-containing protein [Dipodascopsis uninucleata]